MNQAEEFISQWRDTLEKGALLHFSHGPRREHTGNHCQIADGFVTGQGMKPIGFNWELLDAGAPEGERRSGIGELVNALTHDLANPSHAWLPIGQARDCAKAFLSLFDLANLTLVSNRFDGLWNPIAGGAVEWGFLGYDHDQVALLLLASET
ncbi:hypothetical protein [uncultured Erythrobacter sp.]|uniref:hypothetical protein n=1 Tax=uncultured Erythrobacter sp. TaxID=263913 RepID=UPI00262E1DF5|nr:hypothetical protein [uncultured Erythrobacter sp.]